MARIPIFAGKSTFNHVASSTRYQCLVGLSGGSTTEADNSIPWRTTGTFSNMYARVTSNDRATSTATFRKAVGNGNQTFSISGTGEFQDTSNTDTNTAGQLVDIAITTGAGGTTFVVRLLAFCFAATSGTVTRFAANLGGSQTLNAVTRFTHLGDNASAVATSFTATEADAQFKIKTAGTLKNLFVNVRTNTRTTTCTVGIRKNAGNGNGVISIATTVVGVLEDTSNTDSVAVDDLCNYYTTFGADANALRFWSLGVEFATTNNKTHVLVGSAQGYTQLVNVTNYYNLAQIQTDTTEANIQQKALIPYTLSNLECFLQANTIVGASLLRLRKNAGNGNQVISLTSLTAGYFEDTSNTDSIVATDELNYSLVTAAAGTSLIVTSIGMLMTIASGILGARTIQIGSGWGVEMYGGRRH